jgi:hypothetical protein
VLSWPYNGLIWPQKVGFVLLDISSRLSGIRTHNIRIRTNNDLQNTTQKTKYRATRTPLSVVISTRCMATIALYLIFIRQVLVLITKISWSVTCGRSVVFSGTPFSSTNKTDRHDIIGILLKVALTTITLTLYSFGHCIVYHSWIYGFW